MMTNLKRKMGKKVLCVMLALLTVLSSTDFTVLAAGGQVELEAAAAENVGDGAATKEEKPEDDVTEDEVSGSGEIDAEADREGSGKKKPEGGNETESPENPGEEENLEKPENPEDSDNGTDEEIGEEKPAEEPGKKKQEGENIPSETENVEDENEEGTDAVEETVSENTKVVREELEEDADTVMLGARTVTASGKCGDNLTWTLEDDGTLTISGTGEMWDNQWPWEQYLSQYNEPKLVIEDGVTKIGKTAFMHAKFVGELKIPNSVTVIGEAAFNGCKGFTGDLYIPNSVTCIDDFAFDECGFNGGLIIENGIIGKGVFNGCKNFTRLQIGKGVSSIGEAAFGGCTGFTGSLEIPGNVKDIGPYAFNDCTGFTGDLTIKNGVLTIENYAFRGCVVTGNLRIESGEIGEYAFYNVAGGGLQLGDGVTHIGNSAFLGSTFTGELIIPDSVIEMEDYAFNGCKGFTNLQLGNGIKYIPEFAFYGCDGFTGTLIIPNSVNEIGKLAFHGCDGFQELVLRNGIENIGEGAFSSCGFTGDLIIPDSVVSIGEDAFWNCKFNGDLVIGKNVTSIGRHTFEGCTGFSGDLVIDSNIKDLSTNFYGLSGFASFKGNLKVNTNYIPNSVFENCQFEGTLEIGNHVTSIGDNAFKNCSGFTGSLLIPESVTEIGGGAFDHCSGFTGDLIIPKNVTVVESNTFDYCEGFTGSLIFPESVTEIGAGAFNHCDGLTGNITIPNHVVKIGENALGPFSSSKKIYWHCTLNSYGNNCVNGGTVIYDDEVPKPIYLTNSILIKRSDYEASEGDSLDDIQVPSDKAAVCAVDNATGRIIRSARLTIDGQIYQTDIEGIYYFSLGQSSAIKRFIGAEAEGYLQTAAMSMSVQQGKLTAIHMDKDTLSSDVTDNDIQVQDGKFALCATDEYGHIIKNATIMIDGEATEGSGGIFYAEADSLSHYVTASAKGYLSPIPVSVVFSSGEKSFIYLHYREEYNISYKLGKVKSGDVFSQKIWLESGEYNSSEEFDFTKLASLIGNYAVLKLRDGIAVEAYSLEECASLSISLAPEMSSFIYQNGRFSTGAAKVNVKIYYDYKEQFPHELFEGIDLPKFQVSRMTISTQEGMKVSAENQSGNLIDMDSIRTLDVGETCSFEVFIEPISMDKPIKPSTSYKMTVQVAGNSKSYAGYQTFYVVDADYKKEQTDRRPTAEGSDVSKASVTNLLENNILFNMEGTVLEKQYFSKEQLKAIEKILTLWIVNIDAATDTAREISYEEKFVTDVLKKLKVNIKPYLGVSETTAQMRIKAKTKSYGERTIIFTLNLTNYTWEDQAPFGRFGTVEWRVENTNDIPANYQEGITSMIAKANTDRFLAQMKELAFSSIKEAYNKAWGGKANKVAEMIMDKRILDLVNQEFGSVSDMYFRLMIAPTEQTIKQGSRKKSRTRCPVDLYVYDGQGNIAGAIINDIAYPMDDGVLVYLEDGAKVIDYFDDEYSVKFVGNGTGTMSHEVLEYYNTGERVRQIVFNEVPLTDGKVYLETIPDYFLAPSEVYALEVESGETICPDADSYEEERPDLILVDGISVTPETVNLKIGEEKVLKAVIIPTEASLKLVEWSSDNENVVTVNDAGMIKAVSAGTAKVKLVSVDGKYEAECVVIVDTSGSDESEDPNTPEKPDKPSQGDVLDEDMPQGGIDNIPKGLWISEVRPQSYTGKGIKPEVRVYDYKTLLQVKKDYTISYKNNTKANDAQTAKTAPTITVIGKDNYSGRETQTFQIVPKQITDDDIMADDIAVNYNKKVQKAVPVLVWNGKKLRNKTDYTVEYPDLSGSPNAYKVPGTYTILVKGKGNYGGERKVSLLVTESKLMSKVTVSKIAAQTYTGEEITVATMDKTPTVKSGRTVLRKDVHYTVSYEDNVEIGNAVMILTGTGKETPEGTYTGKKRVTFKITGGNIKKAAVTGIPKNMVFTGTAIHEASPGWGNSIKLSMTGKNQEKKELTEGVDYTLEYQKNTDCGTAQIIFTGINGYSGTLKKSFKITAYDIQKDTGRLLNTVIEGQPVYAKGGCKPKPVVKFADMLLEEGRDYTLSYKNNKAVTGSVSGNRIPTVTIKGKGNFKGSISLTYAIVAQDISNLKLIASDKVFQNRENAFKAVPKVIDLDGKVLKAGTDYEKYYNFCYGADTKLVNGSTRKKGDVISEYDILPVNTPIEMTITGKNNYTGALTGQYRITTADIAKAKVTIPAQTYSGSEITLDKSQLTVKIGQAILLPEDYEIEEDSYTNNVKKGNASVTIRGVGNYGGRKTVKFKIKAKNMLWWWR